MPFGKKAAMRGTGNTDTVANLKSSNQAASNQVRFRVPDIKPGPNARKVGNISQVGPNTKGTGRENITSTMAESGKRKIGIKLPANY